VIQWQTVLDLTRSRLTVRIAIIELTASVTNDFYAIAVAVFAASYFM